MQAFDWLFVDEAGQVGLANMVAMGRAARNIVLAGNPRQLPQMIQGAHPEPANLSCLDWMLGDHAAVGRRKDALANSLCPTLSLVLLAHRSLLRPAAAVATGCCRGCHAPQDESRC